MSVYSHNRSKTHCKRGHVYEDGSYKAFTDKHGHTHRQCLECRRIKEKQRRSGAPGPEIADAYADYDQAAFDAWLDQFPDVVPLG